MVYGGTMTRYTDVNQLPPQYREEAAAQMKAPDKRPLRGPGKTALPIVVNGQAVDIRPRRTHKGPIYQKIVLMGERPESYNDLVRMNRWEWQKEVNRCKDLILLSLPQCDTIQQAVKIVITAYFDKYPYDASNVPGKLFEDGLVRAGLLADDSMKHVLSMTTRSRIDRKRPRVEIELFGENDDLVL